MTQIVNTAIEAALTSDWNKAIEINQEILKETPNSIDALNRLGFAYINLGLPRKAKSTFEKVLKLDPFNPIASKNLKKIKECTKYRNNHSSISTKIFLEEPGTSKTVNLLHLTHKTILSNLHCGQRVNIIIKKNRSEIRTEDNTYLGALPDDLSFRLRKLIKLGNKYEAFVKTVTENQVSIIIHEVKRSKKVKDASFIVKLLPDYHTSLRSDLLEELLEESEPEESGESNEE
ncbi:MAG: tetratricopeptide repeat protein [Patescibacteria group bacterium]|nr:tetratricopeptide repeat protein [Patescibacteria group bacterium]